MPRSRGKKGRMDVAGLLTVSESREMGNDDYSDIIETPAARGRARKQRSRRRKKTGGSRHKSKLDAMMRSSIVSSHYTERMSSLTGDVAILMEDNSYDDTDSGRRRYALRAGHQQRSPRDLDQLHALRDVVGSVAKDGYIDRDTFISTFEVQDAQYDEEFYSVDSNGRIDANAILLDAVLDTNLEETQQLKFIFDLFDTAGVGYINQRQVAKLLKASLEQSKLDVLGMDFTSLAKILFKRLHKRGSDNISFEEFSSVFKDYVGDTYADANAAKHKAPGGTYGEASKAAEWFENNKLRIAWLLLYAVLNVIAFLSKYFKYEFDSAVGLGLQIARGFAQVIMLNFLLVLLPMCRAVVSTLKRSATLWKYVPFDDNIEFHKLCGIVLCTSGLIHSGAHISNEIHLYLLATPDEIADSRFSQIPGFENGLPPFTTTLTQLPVWTGVLLLTIVCISFPLAALSKFRSSNFNVFWYSHMLFGPFLILGAIHGSLSWLAKAQSFWWIIPPLLIYLTERRFRYAKIFTTPVRIARVELMDKTLGLFMETPKRFVYRPGMYLFLNVPALSSHEWHPFTISSAPGDKYVSVHINNAGDWTGALHKLIASHQESGKPFPPVYLDGPVGAPTQDYQRFKTVMIIGGGIGVTPCASILKDTVNLWKEFRCSKCNTVRHPRNFRVQKIYFHWVTRAQDSLRWFEQTMNEVSEMDTGDIVESHQYLTSVKSQDDNLPLKMFQAFVHDETGKDFVSGLKTKQLTHFGRPNWDLTFQTMKKKHPGEEIGVFFCGPHALDRILGQCATKYSDPSTKGTQFDYHSEKFS